MGLSKIAPTVCLLKETAEKAWRRTLRNLENSARIATVVEVIKRESYHN